MFIWLLFCIDVLLVSYHALCVPEVETVFEDVSVSLIQSCFLPFEVGEKKKKKRSS